MWPRQDRQKWWEMRQLLTVNFQMQIFLKYADLIWEYLCSLGHTKTGVLHLHVFDKISFLIACKEVMF